MLYRFIYQILIIFFFFLFFFFLSFFFFFNDTATTEIYTLSLHDALPSSPRCTSPARWPPWRRWARSEEHTSELQSHVNLVCRLLLEKKKKKKIKNRIGKITIIKVLTYHNITNK